MQIWDQFLTRLEKELGSEAVQNWVRPLRLIRFDAANLYLEAEDAFQLSWFNEHVRPYLKEPLQNNNGRPIKVRLELADKKTSSDLEKREAFSALRVEPDPLDPEMTFNTFLVSPENELPLSIAAELSFNPIYLFGPKGSGKTHLLQAIAAQARSEGKKAFYVRAETFTEHVVQAIRASLMQGFRKAYREIDLLLVDDIHLFSRKTATQEEFFHTFNALHTAGKPILFSSNLPPSKLTEIEPRLTSRFEWGISLELQKVSSEEIFRQKTALWKVALSEELTQFFLATFPLDPITPMQALLVRQKESPLTVEAARQILADFIEAEKKEPLTSAKIIERVAEYFSLSQEELLGKSQARNVAHARQIAMYFCREKLKLPLQEIGRIFKRDHSTVMSGIRRVEKEAQEKEKELLDLLRN